jgi:predicted GTPase
MYFVQVTQLKASEQMHAVASEQQQKEANIKEALEEQLAQVRRFI